MNSDWSRCLSKVGETISLWQCLVIHDMEWEFGYMTAVFLPTRLHYYYKWKYIVSPFDTLGNKC